MLQIIVLRKYFISGFLDLYLIWIAEKKSLRLNSKMIELSMPLYVLYIFYGVTLIKEKINPECVNYLIKSERSHVWTGTQESLYFNNT